MKLWKSCTVLLRKTKIELRLLNEDSLNIKARLPVADVLQAEKA